MELIKIVMENDIWGDSTLYIGETQDIKAIYNSIARNQVTNIRPLYAEKPVFSKNRLLYGLSIQKEEVTVVNSDTCLYILLKVRERKIQNCIDAVGAQPTAYDLERVVEQLEEHFNSTENKTARLAYHHAIKIVRGGGTDES